jgi:hypothetical protein
MTKEEQMDIQSEIEGFVRSNPGIIAPSWLTHAIIMAHEDEIQGRGKDWWVKLGASAIRAEVGSFFRRQHLAESESSTQELLPGFERLQVRYIIARDGEKLSVPIEMASDEELLAKADEQECHAAGYIQHAKELRRYVSRRTTGPRRLVAGTAG